MSSIEIEKKKMEQRDSPLDPESLGDGLDGDAVVLGDSELFPIKTKTKSKLVSHFFVVPISRSYDRAAHLGSLASSVLAHDRRVFPNVLLVRRAGVICRWPSLRRRRRRLRSFRRRRVDHGFQVARDGHHLEILGFVLVLAAPAEADTRVGRLGDVARVEAVLVLDTSNEERVVGGVLETAADGVFEVLHVGDGLASLPDDAGLDIVRGREHVVERGVEFFSFVVGDKVAAALVEAGGALGAVGGLFELGAGDKETHLDFFAFLVLLAGGDVTAGDSIGRDVVGASANLLSTCK